MKLPARATEPHPATFGAPSPVVRYARDIGRDPAWMARVAIAEGMRIISPVLAYKGAIIDLLDASSLMHTGTFKAHVAALAVAESLARGQRRFVTASSGNTAAACAAYTIQTRSGGAPLACDAAQAHGVSGALECFCFVPAGSHYKLDRRWFEHPRVHLFLLDVPEPALKRIAADFCSQSGIPRLPTLDQQIDAGRLRAFYLAEEHKRGRPEYDWTVQALSGGFGPIGFYEGITQIAGEGRWPCETAPAFLGVQQQGNCPFVRVRGSGFGGQKDVLEPTLYATQPEGRPALERIVAEFGGRFIAVADQAYRAREAELLDLLGEHGLTCGRSRFHPEQPIVERSGLLALAGTLEAIERGTIRAGSRVLVCFTGGCGPDLETPATPEIALRAGEPVEQFWGAVREYIEGEVIAVSNGSAVSAASPWGPAQGKPGA